MINEVPLYFALLVSFSCISFIVLILSYDFLYSFTLLLYCKFTHKKFSPNFDMFLRYLHLFLPNLPIKIAGRQRLSKLEWDCLDGSSAGFVYSSPIARHYVICDLRKLSEYEAIASILHEVGHYIEYINAFMPERKLIPQMTTRNVVMAEQNSWHYAYRILESYLRVADIPEYEKHDIRVMFNNRYEYGITSYILNYERWERLEEVMEFFNIVK